MTNPATSKNTRSAQNLLRVQYQKRNNFFILVVAVFGGLTAYFAYSVNKTFGLVIQLVCLYIVLKFIQFVVDRMGLFVPKGPFVEEILNRSDDQILFDEFVRMGGRRLVFAKFTNNVGNTKLTAISETYTIAARLREYFMTNGVLLTDSSHQSDIEVKGIIGCGFRGLNPTLVTITLNENGNGAEVSVNAIAKAGLIKDNAAVEATNCLSEYMKAEFKAIDLSH